MAAYAYRPQGLVVSIIASPWSTFSSVCSFAQGWDFLIKRYTQLPDNLLFSTPLIIRKSRINEYRNSVYTILVPPSFQVLLLLPSIPIEKKRRKKNCPKSAWIIILILALFFLSSFSGAPRPPPPPPSKSRRKVGSRKNRNYSITHM